MKHFAHAVSWQWLYSTSAFECDGFESQRASKLRDLWGPLLYVMPRRSEPFPEIILLSFLASPHNLNPFTSWYHCSKERGSPFASIGRKRANCCRIMPCIAPSVSCMLFHGWHQWQSYVYLLNSCAVSYIFWVRFCLIISCTFLYNVTWLKLHNSHGRLCYRWVWFTPRFFRRPSDLEALACRTSYVVLGFF